MVVMANAESISNFTIIGSQKCTPGPASIAGVQPSTPQGGRRYLGEESLGMA